MQKRFEFCPVTSYNVSEVALRGGYPDVQDFQTHLNDFLTAGRWIFVREIEKGSYFRYMTPGKKYTIFTSVFYLVLLPLIPILNRYSPSGPCTPGLGMLLFLLILLLAPIAFLYSLIGRLRGHRSFTGSTIINAVVVLSLGILLSSGRL